MYWRGPEACTETVADGISGALGMVSYLVEAFDTGTGKKVQALTDGTGAVETNLAALLTDVTVAEHVLIGRRRAWLLSITTDGASYKGYRN